MTRHFLDLADLDGDTLATILDDALTAKEARTGKPKGAADAHPSLSGHTLAMIFEKNSTRTRTSFDMAIRQLGGSSMVLESGTMQLGRGETVADTARVLSRYVDAIMIRTDDHAKLVEMAEYASVPVINGLTDRSHPCQIMADMLTVLERLNRLAGTKWAWLGDGNNVLTSIIEAGSLLKFDVAIACPESLLPPSDIVTAARERGGTVDITLDPATAVEHADVVVTDTWISMGQQGGDAKLAALEPFQVTEQLMARAKDDAVFLHCLPAHRGEEVTSAVIDGPQSAIWDEAENRLHAQKAILRWCFGQIG
ncbi:ornithine carbamoyltransferase [Parasphingopyxis lamellibrachiae]|uniref:Ornithine carbamoyltransferase n=1 Tax=Parasphingopyxis lamellibrachiae TaxID=680125 RepID=A0A3D9FC18_9SPHN|nr:ornithine carbamoyltransferase [Parasphingopyxis lamellibrachiae]RED15228.1 ornithine carbamoyltransferase [Parasphingopyxis lamellibrachiae]